MQFAFVENNDLLCWRSSSRYWLSLLNSQRISLDATKWAIPKTHAMMIMASFPALFVLLVGIGPATRYSGQITNYSEYSTGLTKIALYDLQQFWFWYCTHVHLGFFFLRKQLVWHLQLYILKMTNQYSQLEDQFDKACIFGSSMQYITCVSARLWLHRHLVKSAFRIVVQYALPWRQSLLVNPTMLDIYETIH